MGAATAERSFVRCRFSSVRTESEGLAPLLILRTTCRNRVERPNARRVITLPPPLALHSDGGQTWLAQESRTRQNLYALYFDKKTGWAVGGDGLVLRYER